MAKNIMHIVHHRRRREGKTDYRVRFHMIRTRNMRFVVRKSLKNTIINVVQYDPKGDRSIVTTNSQELRAYGWLGHTGNIPAAYLTGLLCGRKALGSNIKSAVLDIGLYRSTKAGRLYAALKGGVDAGLQIPFSEGVLPPEDRLRGGHISAYASKMKSEAHEIYKKTFTAYHRNKLAPEDLPKNFEEVKKKILSSSFTAEKKAETAAPAERKSKVKKATKTTVSPAKVEHADK